MEERNLLWVTSCWLPELSTKKYSHTLKAESYFMWGGMFRTLSLEIASQQLWENCSKGAGGAVRPQTSLQQRVKAVWTSKIRYQVKGFSILPLGRCKPLSSLKSFLSHAPQLSGANLVSLFTLFLHSPSSSEITLGSGSIPWIPVWGALIHIWRPEIADGCDISCLLIWQEMFSSDRTIRLPWWLRWERKWKWSRSVVSDSWRPCGL